MNACKSLGRQNPPKPSPARRKLVADARIFPHGAHDFFDVRAELLGQIGDHIGVGNFQREK